jgi:hypothetical protein
MAKRKVKREQTADSPPPCPRCGFDCGDTCGPLCWVCDNEITPGTATLVLDERGWATHRTCAAGLAEEDTNG